MSLLEELKRRNVIRVGLAYLVLSWLLLQVGDVMFEALRLPDWAITMLLAFLVIGAVPVLAFSWIYELTPEGVRRESEIDRSQTITGQTGKRLDVVIILLLVGAIALTAFDRFYPEDPGSSSTPPAAAPRPGVVAEETGPASASARGGEAAAISRPDPASTAAATRERAVAVLPFVAMSDDESTGYFADGLSEELLNVLARIPDLQVPGRTSSFAFKDRNVDLREIGEALGVATLLEGSVRQQGDRVRVTAQLVRADDGYHLWSETYDRTLDDIFAIQDDIASNVARALTVVLDDQARARMNQAGTRNVDAFLAYRRGVELAAVAHSELPLLPTLAEADTHFAEAIRLDPQFAAPWLVRADYFAHLLMEFDVSSEARVKAHADLIETLDRAYELARLPARKASIAVDRILFSDDWSALRSRVMQAIEAEGCPAPTWMAIANVLGIGEPLVGYWRKNFECDPLAPIAAAEYAFSLAHAGDPQTAEEVIDAFRRRVGQTIFVSKYHHNLLLRLHRVDEAMALTDEIPETEPFYGISARVLPLAQAGRIEEASATFDALVERNGRASITHLRDLIALGRREEAFELLRELDDRPGGAAMLAFAAMECLCGEPWDLSITPNFARRVQEAEIPWPPPLLIDYPAKDW